MTLVTLVKNAGSDRDVGRYFWTSTDKDEDAYTCPIEEIVRIIRFGMKAQPTVHATPFGHDSITFCIDEIPLAIAEQWLRHRVFNFSKKSYRYVKAGANFYEPAITDLRVQVGRPGHYTFEPMDEERALRCLTRMRETYEICNAAYLYLAEDEGLCLEQARLVLPTATYTKMYVTGSLRSWLNFLVQRNDSHAQLEIQYPAREIEEILTAEYPITMSIWKEYGRRIV